MSKIHYKLGQSFNFSFWNPTGHYELNIGNPVERDIAISLIVQSKEVYKRIAAGERADRSQMGNKSCFRNERFNC